MHIVIPSTRKQNAKEKRERQSDVMSEELNLDVMLRTYFRNELAEQENNSEIDLDLKSDRQQQRTSRTIKNFRSLLNAYLSENSVNTAETNRVINSEISSQMSRKLDEIKSDLNFRIMELINSAIEGKILSSIENAVSSNEAAKNTKWDLRSDGRHPSTAEQTTQKLDSQSHRLHKSKFNQQTKCFSENFPRLIATSINHIYRRRDNSVDFDTNDEGYDSPLQFF